MITTDFDPVATIGMVVPYPPLMNEARTNRGFTDLRGRPDLAAQVAEGSASDALRMLLIDLAQPQSPIFSLGCDLGAHRDNEATFAPCFAGGYIQILGALYAQNWHDQYLALAEALENTMPPDDEAHEWELHFSLENVCMKVDGADPDDFVPTLKTHFFARADDPDAALASREALLLSLGRALRDKAVISCLESSLDEDEEAA